jgi:hypothetical protein
MHIHLEYFDNIALLKDNNPRKNEINITNVVVSILRKINISFSMGYKIDDFIKHEKDIQIHLGLQNKELFVERKKKNTSKLYDLFFSNNPNFYVFEAMPKHNKIPLFDNSNLVYISKGSYNHNYKELFPVKKYKFKSFEKYLNLPLQELKINHTSNYIVVLIQNYNPIKCWFGWKENDFYIWLERETKVIDIILNKTTKDIIVKFHPNTLQKYVSIFINKNCNKNLKYCDELESSIFDICKDAYCCIVNSGTSALALCILGIPIFYIDDYYSTLPMSVFGRNIEDVNLNSFCVEDLPCQSYALDLIASQWFHFDELENLILSIEVK